MATYLERYALLGDQPFAQRITVAMMMAAYTIINEPVNTPEHARRMKWAGRVQQDAVKTPMRLIALRVLIDPLVDGTSSDVILQARVDLIIPELIQLEVENT